MKHWLASGLRWPKPARAPLLLRRPPTAVSANRSASAGSGSEGGGGNSSDAAVARRAGSDEWKVTSYSLAGVDSWIKRALPSPISPV
jgi:hypothetical protein